MTTPYASESFLHQLLGKAIAASASDVHLKVGQPPGARVRGDMVYFRVEKIRPEDTEAAARILFGSAAAGGRLDALREVVASYTAPSLGRFRVSLYRQRGALSIVMRSIPLEVPKLAQLGVPAAATAMIEQRSGLVLVTGGAGQGKTSTLAAMVGHLNASYPKHIITLEDPIEFEHEDQRASVSQRAVGADTDDIPSGLYAAARQDPDVIVVSDVRDGATVEGMLDAIEAGRLVLASVIAPDVPRAIARLVWLGGGSPELRNRLADALGGVIAQRLVNKRDGSAQVLASEVLVGTGAVRDALRHAGGAAQVKELMEKGATPYGMQTFEVSIKQLVTQGTVSKSMISIVG